MTLILHFKRYIGIDKPKLQYNKIEYYKEPSIFEDSDNMPADPEQNRDEDWTNKNVVKTDK